MASSARYGGVLTPTTIAGITPGSNSRSAKASRSTRNVVRSVRSQTTPTAVLNTTRRFGALLPAFSTLKTLIFAAECKTLSLPTGMAKTCTTTSSLYNDEQLDLKTPYALDLDHIVEKQCFTFAIYKLKLHEEDGDFALATEMLRESVVNELGNLTLTRSITNRVKGSGVFNYLDDSRTGHLDQKNFTSYLQAAKRDGKKLTRENTRSITRNMGKSMKICQRKLHDEGDTPVFNKLSKQMQQLYVDMELKASK